MAPVRFSFSFTIPAKNGGIGLWHTAISLASIPLDKSAIIDHIHSRSLFLQLVLQLGRVSEIVGELGLIAIKMYILSQ